MKGTKKSAVQLVEHEDRVIHVVLPVAGGLTGEMLLQAMKAAGKSISFKRSQPTR